MNLDNFKEINIPNNNSCYFINNEGVVYSKKTDKLLTGLFNGRYFQVKLHGKLYINHRLVMMTFYPIENMKSMYVNHKDKNTCNNNIYNLEWTTQKENIEWNKINSKLSIHPFKRKFDKIKSLPDEVWRYIPFLKDYAVSNLGRIKSNERVINNIKYSELLFKGTPRKEGYVRVEIRNNNKKIRYYLHRLIAISFLENPNNLPQVNHIDGNKSNNILSNLEWVSRKENAIHARDILGVQQMGEKHYKTNFTDKDILAIKDMRHRGIKLREISSIYGVHLSTIGKIVTNVNWKQIKKAI